MSAVAITIATWDYDRVRPLIDGRVTVEGCDINYLVLAPEECFHRAHRHKEFEVSELGFTPYLNALSRDDLSYVAIPVFPSRMFRHSAIYIRDDRGIETPADLGGKRVGVPEYQMTAALWVRGMLQDDHGVAYGDINWLEGGLEQYGRKSKYALRLPDGFPLEQMPEGRSLSEMLETGDLDAVVSARAPSCFTRRQPGIRRLFEDFRSVEQDYFRRSGIFPIMHTLGIRKDVLDRHPWIASSLFKAFNEAKRLADRDLDEVTALKIGLPWVVQEAAETRAVMGDDFWSYGVAPNRRTLEALVRYSFEQGLSERLLGVDELFAASTLETSKI